MTKKSFKIVILSGNHLCHNPRVLKEADALAEGGHEVEILTTGVNPNYLRRDKRLAHGKKWKINALMSELAGAQRFKTRAKRLLGSLAHRWLRLENKWQLGEMAQHLYKESKRKGADLYIAHSEPAMWAAEQLRKEGKRVGVDMEDWFSEDLLPQARRDRPIRLLKQLEKNLLCHGVHSSCTSEAMADALVKAYRCPRPTVIRNVFPQKDRETLDQKWKDRPGMAKWIPKNDPKTARPKEAAVSIHWFSQTIGPGRGLEILFQALERLEGSWEMHLRGNLKGYEGWLDKACPASVMGRLKVHGLVENKELLSRIAEHDIGYAGELAEPPSRNLTITNKFFQYIQGGLAVVASDTAGQVEGASEAKGAILNFRNGESISLAERVGRLLRDRGALQKMRQSAWNAGARLTWENESQRILAAWP